MIKVNAKRNPAFRTAAFATLGCKVNQYETQIIRESLKKRGYKLVEWDETADVYIINTCTVTVVSDRKSRQLIRRAVSANPDATIVVTGCYAERSPDEVDNIPGVSLVMPNREKFRIVDHLEEFFNPIKPTSCQEDIFEDKWHIGINRFDGQTRALVKIQDGCDSFCSYCIVPYTRGGKISSRPIESVVDEVKRLVKSGHGEVILTGIHLGAYGRDMKNGTELAHVIRAIHDIDGLKRIRLSSIEPVDVSHDLISTMARLPKCAHHFHISLQSGSDKILRLMRRGYTAKEFEDLAERIRSIMPDVGLSTDVMVGFPGETDKDFRDTYNLIARVRFNRLHVFRYSPRSGTPAVEFPDQVQEGIAYKRSQEIRELGDRLAQDFRMRMLGKKAHVLVEDKREGKDKLLSGFTDNYMRVLVRNAKDELAGQIVGVNLVDIEDEYIIGMNED
jgi:threonylcarbamoyladenosine tRNA methylthiotransferase MtaB